MPQPSSRVSVPRNGGMTAPRPSRTIRAIWPNVKAALAWIDGAGDPDGDSPNVEYGDDTFPGLLLFGEKKHAAWQEAVNKVSKEMASEKDQAKQTAGAAA